MYEFDKLLAYRFMSNRKYTKCKICRIAILGDVYYFDKNVVWFTTKSSEEHVAFSVYKFIVPCTDDRLVFI